LRKGSHIAHNRGRLQFVKRAPVILTCFLDFYFIRIEVFIISMFSYYLESTAIKLN